MRLSKLFVATTIVAVVALVVMGGPSLAKEKDKDAQPPKDERWSAWVVSTDGPTGGQTGRLYVTVESWSTPEERAALFGALKTGGQKELKKVLDKMQKGWMKFATTLRWTVNHAATFDTPKGRVVRLLTIRPIFFVETETSAITMEYEFGAVELLLDEQGNGEGVLIPAAKIKFNEEGKLEIETPPRDITPVKLNKVRKEN